MRLVFFGTGSFAIPALRALSPHVVLVVTQPDRPAGRNMRMNITPTKQAAIELGIPFAAPEKARAIEFVEHLESMEADALVVASYGQILSQRVLDSAKRGGINLHGSILPRYRGAAPIQRCIENGDTETGITLMQMDRGMDTGDIIEIVRTPIEASETYGELQDRLAEIAAQMAVTWMPRIVDGDYTRTSQDSSMATLAPKIEKNEAELSIERSAQGEFNRFRAFTPSPGAFMRTEFGFIKVSVAAISAETAPPGTIIATQPNLRIAFASESIDLIEIQPEGKKRMSGRDFANGARLKPNMRFV